MKKFRFYFLLKMSLPTIVHSWMLSKVKAQSVHACISKQDQKRENSANFGLAKT